MGAPTVQDSLPPEALPQPRGFWGMIDAWFTRLADETVSGTMLILIVILALGAGASIFGLIRLWIKRGRP